MATATELNEGSGEYELGRRNDSTARRTFYVDVPPRDADLLTATNLPALNSAHPDFPLTLDKYRTRRAVDGNTLIDCLYSNDGRFSKRPQIDELDEEFFSWSFDIERVSVEYPRLERMNATFPSASGGSPEQKLIWKRETATLNEDRPVWILRTSASDLGGNGPDDPGIALNSTEFQYIRSQNRRVHEIQGVKYGFQFGQTQQQRGDRWQIEYRWTYDPGTTIELEGFPTGGYSGTYNHIGDNATAAEQLIRLPCFDTPTSGDSGTSKILLRPAFTRIDVRPPAISSGVIDPTGDRAFFRLYDYLEDDLDGWETLPGITVASP